MHVLRTRVLVPVLLAALGAVHPASAQQTTRPTLAIVDFETTPGGSTLPPPHVGETVAALMLDRLVASNQYHVLDGRWLEHGNRTQRNVDTLRADASAAGVDYLLFGSITRFSTENGQRRLGGAAFFLPVLAGYRKNKTELVVGLMVRMVDVGTGEVVTTATGLGSSLRTKLALGGLGLHRAGGAGGLSSGASSLMDFRDALLDEAIVRSVQAAAAGLVNAAPRIGRLRAASTEK